MDPFIQQAIDGGEYTAHPANPALLYRFLTKGDNTAHPTASDRVTVHYEGKLTDGKVFDSSYRRGQTISFGLGQVIAGWTLSVQQMSVGDKIEVIIPYNLAYGERGMPGVIPPRATLVFVIELFQIN